MKLNKIYNMDCLEGMKDIPDKSVDMILCDLPYGTTACKWDTVIPFKPLWEQYNRVIKDNGAIVLFGNQPFSSKLINSNINNYKYDWIWNKKVASNSQLCKYQPLKITEYIHIFSKKTHFYFPQDVEDCHIVRSNKNRSGGVGHISSEKKRTYFIQNKTGYPKNILDFKPNNIHKKHPTQKPVALCEYLIKTYTNEGKTVLDNCMGSGTTAIACINTNRNFIGFELDKNYYDIANKRIAEAMEVSR